MDRFSKSELNVKGVNIGKVLPPPAGTEERERVLWKEEGGVL
jgi:hypothetical protein